MVTPLTKTRIINFMAKTKGSLWRAGVPPLVTAEWRCGHCNKEMRLTKVQDWHRRERGKTLFFCGKPCAMHWKRMQPEIRARIEEGRRKGSEGFAERVAWARFERGNPIRRPEVRAKLSASMKAAGIKPKVLGGNGRAMPAPQAMLLAALGEAWVAEFVVPTGWPPPPKHPTHFKIDLAHPEMMIAVEVDGSSHHTPLGRERDRRKEAFLRQCGWQVFRFSNQAVMENTADCVQAVLSSTSKLRNTTTTSPKEH